MQRPISIDEFREGLVPLGVPDAYVDLLVYLFEVTVSGVNAEPTGEVERVLGRPPRSFRAFAASAAAAGAFDIQEVPNG